jgi:hypothetical protein
VRDDDACQELGISSYLYSLHTTRLAMYVSPNMETLLCNVCRRRRAVRRHMLCLCLYFFVSYPASKSLLSGPDYSLLSSVVWRATPHLSTLPHKAYDFGKKRKLLNIKVCPYVL